jgi:hypothetical protein
VRVLATLTIAVLLVAGCGSEREAAPQSTAAAEPEPYPVAFELPEKAGGGWRMATRTS